MNESDFYPPWLNPANIIDPSKGTEQVVPSYISVTSGEMQQNDASMRMMQSENPQQGFTVPDAVYAKLFYEQELLAYQTNSRMALMDHENVWRERLTYVEENIRERRMKKIEENRERRDLASLGVYEDSEGRICYELKDYEGNRIGSKILVKCKGLSLICLWSNHLGQREEMYLAQWRNPESQIVLSKCSPQEMEKKLAKEGVAIQCGKERRKILIDLLFAFLREHMVEHELPYAVGWNRMSSGRWHFESESENTLRGLKG